MTTYVPKDVLEGLEAARIAGLKKASRLRVLAGDDYYPVLRKWKNGFAVENTATPRLRGLVDLYEGPNHLCQCLIVASEEDGSEICYEFKRATAVADRPALDFYREPDAPVALIEDARGTTL
jgi:hypothetical protein